jgi:hypothetical protein
MWRWLQRIPFLSPPGASPLPLPAILYGTVPVVHRAACDPASSGVLPDMEFLARHFSIEHLNLPGRLTPQAVYGPLGVCRVSVLRLLHLFSIGCTPPFCRRVLR